MNKLYHSPLFEHIKKYLKRSNSRETLFLFVPYVKTKVLEKLLEKVRNKIVIVTTWKPKDILFGSSELALYPFCQKHGIALYVSNSMHLKIYSVGLTSGILATGNVSHRGMLPGGNYEAAVKIDLTNEDRLFFSKIRNEARLVDDKMYEELKEWYEKNKTDVPEPPALSDIVSEPRKDAFSVASLPMTHSVDELISGYIKISLRMEPSRDSETAACIFHDLVNYGISSGLSIDTLRNELSQKFFDHPFIQKIDEFITPEAHFGSIKEWIQNNCTDVPVPSRRELTGNVQVLLEWFEKLGNDRYVIDVPGKHSQRIRKISVQDNTRH